MKGIYSPEISDLLDKISNWRRYYKIGLRIESVPYYTPPRSGSTVNDEIIQTLEPETQKAVLESIRKQRDEINRLPPKMQEAVKLELCWRNLEDTGKKFFIKYEHIDQLSKSQNGCFMLWRKMKNHGIRIRTFAQHDEFDRKALEYLHSQLGG